MTCGECKYGRIVEGECRRRAPGMVVFQGPCRGDNDAMSYWPDNDDRGCGEFVQAGVADGTKEAASD